MTWLRRPAVLLALAAVVVASGLLIWLFWPDPERPPARERSYEAFTACLLTDDKGLAGESAAAAWEGMQQVSLARAIKVQYLAVDGPQTAANAAAYFNTLGLQGCRVVVVVGAAPTEALAAGRARFPQIRYVAVGAAAGAPEVAVVPADPNDQISAGVRRALEAVWAENVGK